MRLSIDDKTKVGKIMTPVAEPKFINVGGFPTSPGYEPHAW